MAYFNQDQTMKKITSFIFLIFICKASFAAFLGISPLYDTYQGNSEVKECWNTFMVDTIGNTNQPSSEIAKLIIKISVIKRGKNAKPEKLELRRVDHRFLIGVLANPNCSESFAVTEVFAADDAGVPIPIDLWVNSKNNFVSKAIKLSNESGK